MSSLFDRLQTDTPARRWIAEHLDYPHSEWCLFWPFGLNQGGYAQVGAEAVKVHRIMCEHKRGLAPDDRPFAAHECGNGNIGCVNPNHVLWKTHAENMLDMHKHTPRGSRYKLTPAQVDEIRTLQGRARIIDIAEQFGVCDVTIRQIHSGKIWKDTSSRQIRVLTPGEVQAIRSTPWQVKSARQWAEELGSTRSAIDRVRGGKTYKWVEASPPSSADRAAP